MITIQEFVNTWDELHRKMFAIARLESCYHIPKYYKMESDEQFFKHQLRMIVDVKRREFEFTLTEYHFGDDDYYSIVVSFDDINKPLLFFDEKFKRELEQMRKEDEERRFRIDENNRKARLEMYAKLKEEFEKQ